MSRGTGSAGGGAVGDPVLGFFRAVSACASSPPERPRLVVGVTRVVDDGIGQAYEAPASPARAAPSRSSGSPWLTASDAESWLSVGSLPEAREAELPAEGDPWL